MPDAPQPPIIEVRDVTRDFPADRDRRTLFRVLRDSIAGNGAAPARRHALRGITLSVSRGEKVAIIGNNAAGKSTLLKVVAGLLRPTTGSAQVRGEMVLLTALGSGMVDEVSVLDNALMYGALYGRRSRVHAHGLHRSAGVGRHDRLRPRQAEDPVYGHTRQAGVFHRPVHRDRHLPHRRGAVGRRRQVSGEVPRLLR